MSHKKSGRKKELDSKRSKDLAIRACNTAGGPYALSKILKIDHGHLSRCRIGEAGLSENLASKITWYLSKHEK